jgi:hypothetical protein
MCCWPFCTTQLHLVQVTGSLRLAPSLPQVTAATVHAFFGLRWLAPLLLAGGLPHQTSPRFKKDECTAAFMSEYDRRGRPIEANRLSPEQVHATVLSHFQQNGVGPHAAPLLMASNPGLAAPAVPAVAVAAVPAVAPVSNGVGPAVVPDAAMPDAAGAGVMPDLYDVVYQGGSWHLALYDGEEQHLLPLPPLLDSGCGYWSMVEHGGDMYVFQGVGTAMVNCNQMFIDSFGAGSSSTSANMGVATASALLPGMVAEGSWP